MEQTGERGGKASVCGVDANTDAVSLLYQQLGLLNDASARVKALQETLKHSTSGKGVREAVKELEKSLTELFSFEKVQETFLRQRGFPTMSDSLAALPPARLSAAQKLLRANAALERRLRGQLVSAQTLLQHSKEFVDFHVNVMNQAQASETYAPPGAATIENPRGVKMFDANV